MAKKKKTALKPVARGFTTTSIPSKKAIEALPDDDEAVNANISENVTAQGLPRKEAVEENSDFDPDKVEEQSLQNLVDKYQDKTEKEITRTLKGIEYDKRMAQVLPHIDLDPLLRDRILALYLESEPNQRITLDQPESQLLPKLGITYGVLCRLGFSEDRVLECLDSIATVELDDAINWLYLHCHEEEPPFGKERPETWEARLGVPLVEINNDDTQLDLEAVPMHRSRDPSPPIRPTETPPMPNVVDQADSLYSELGDDETLFGTLLDEVPSTETSNTGTIITLRNMAFPKFWAGKTPKTLLSETVLKVDRYAAINYRQVGGASRALRAGVIIRWEGGRVREWEMDQDGCFDLGQAEQFIATVALHALTFTETVGFAAGSVLGGSQPNFRLLPPAFRDFWNELEDKRKDEYNKFNRSAWAKLRVILESKLGATEKVASERSKLSALQTNQGLSQHPAHTLDLSPNQLIAGFQARRASPAYQEMLTHRNKLPIAKHRKNIIEILETSQVLVLSGETGCGKSTQLPAFILEDQLSRGKPCRIYCTEPRRISAISLAQRVSREMGDTPGQVGTIASLVGYSIRLESHINRNTRLAFVTNGIALRMLERDLRQGGQGSTFDEITHIIIDEVHERSIESDFLLIVLKSLLEQRKDLKVILMSATVDADKFSNFFGGCPTLHVTGRTFPVDVRYLEDSVEFTGWSIQGTHYEKHAQDRYFRSGRKEWHEDAAATDDNEDSLQDTPSNLEKRYSANTVMTVNNLDERQIPYDLIVKILERLCFEDQACMPYSMAILIFMPGLAEIRRLHDMLCDHEHFGVGHAFRIYPLHSTISNYNQAAVFDIPPVGVRKIVIASNIAETGITIPDITCVIDTGRHREMRFDEKRQISRLVETFVAKSNAMQRRGRAGRVQNGICFHLFTKWRYESQMAEHPVPEMLRLSLSDVALKIKILEIGTSIEDVLSRALDPPSKVNVQRAVSSLIEVKALTTSEEITSMGRLLSKLPIDVHLGKFLLIATLFRCLDPALTIAATLNSKTPFLRPFGHEAEADRAKNSLQIENSDFLTIHNAFASWRKASANGVAKAFCKKHYLSHQNLQEIEGLRQQLLGYLIDSRFIQVDKSYEQELSRARYGRHQTQFISPPAHFDHNSIDYSLLNAALVAGFYPKVLSIDGTSWRTITNNQITMPSPSSVNFRRQPKDLRVKYLCYFTLMHSKKLYAWETGPIDDLSLILLCGEANFKHTSGSVFIDRKIKFQTSSPKTNLALEYLRGQISTIIAARMRGKVLSELQEAWYNIAMLVLGRIKAVAMEKEADRIPVSVHSSTS